MLSLTAKGIPNSGRSLAPGVATSPAHRRNTSGSSATVIQVPSAPRSSILARRSSQTASGVVHPERYAAVRAAMLGPRVEPATRMECPVGVVLAQLVTDGIGTLHLNEL